MMRRMASTQSRVLKRLLDVCLGVDGHGLGRVVGRNGHDRNRRDGGIALLLDRNCQPSFTGIIRSSRMRSGAGDCRRQSSASDPFDALDDVVAVAHEKFRQRSSVAPRRLRLGGGAAPPRAPWACIIRKDTAGSRALQPSSDPDFGGVDGTALTVGNAPTRADTVPAQRLPGHDRAAEARLLSIAYWLTLR